MTNPKVADRPNRAEYRFDPREAAGTPSVDLVIPEGGPDTVLLGDNETVTSPSGAPWAMEDGSLLGPLRGIVVETSGNLISLSTERRVQLLEDRVEELEAEVSRLSSLLEGGEEVVVLRTVSREEAKREIQELFESGETLYFSDISRRLRIDIPLVVEICNELKEEGLIGVDDANPA